MDELNLAIKKHLEGNLHEAEVIYRKILTGNPMNSDAWHMLGLIAYQTGNYKPAIDLINKAISLNPSSALYYNNLAMSYQSIGDERSIKNFEIAVKLNPNYENAHLAYYNLGLYYKDIGDFESALTNFNKAIELKKDFSDAIWNRGLILLLKGDFKQGWEDYEYRFKKENPSETRIFPKNQWALEQNSKVLVIGEQGFGDNILFIRYLQLMKDKNCQIILECRKELINLFKGMADDIIEKNKNQIPIVDYDYYIHLMSLPRVFETNLENIPKNVPYLKADDNLVTKFKKIVTGKPKVGICWAGNINQENDKNRSTTYKQFKILQEVPDISFFSLQKDKRDETISEISDLSPYLNDFSETAAIIENLDLVISVDTSIAHLTGALNKPIWTLVSCNPAWSYMLDRNDSQWYPSMKIFRQKEPGNWGSLLNEVKIELEKYKNANINKINTIIL